MRKQSLLFLFAILFGGNSYSQNTNLPDGYNFSGIPTGTASSVITYPLNYNASPNTAPTVYNYSREFVPLKPMSSIPAFEFLNTLPVLVSTTYTDGFGNALMSINRTNTGSDIVSLNEVRASNTSIGYMPYPTAPNSKFSNAVFTNQKNYYDALYGSEGATAYNRTESYSNQGQPTSKSYSPGKSFTGSNTGTTSTSNFNDANQVPIISLSGNNICLSGNFYGANQLLVSRTVGQHNQESIQFSDKSGRLICKKVYAGGTQGNSGWLITYYLYNEMGKLIYIIPPMAYTQFATNTCLADIAKLCYSYSYDQFGNVISKSTPGKDYVDVVLYDKNYRPLMSQTSLQKTLDQWSFMVSDHLGRVMFSGIYTGTQNYSYWSGILKGTTTPTTYYQSSVAVPANQTLEYWLMNGFSGTYPTTLYNGDIQSFNYYDSYGTAPANLTSFNSSFSNYFLTGAEMVTPQPYLFAHGKLTASKTKIITNSVSNNFANEWITTVIFYDEKSRIIQTQTLNPWNAYNTQTPANTLWDIATIQYNFSGQSVLNIMKHHSWSGTNKTSTIIQKWFQYNASTGRLDGIKQKIDNAPWHVINAIGYDQLGRVSTKWIGTVEQQKYTYNIRGQLTHINKDQVWETNNANFPATVRFSEGLFYEAGFTKPRYDGAVSGFVWHSDAGPVSAYGYRYDDAGRMTWADYRDYSVVGSAAIGWNKDNRNYSVANISFDANGNMKTMEQYGLKTATQLMGLIDDFDYTYETNSNRLKKVKDNGSPSPIDDLEHPNSTVKNQATQYGYDADGNLRSDANKNITGIVYNHLDLPVEVIKGNGATIKNIYDAGGTLIQKTITENSVTTTYRYWGPFVYKDDVLESVLHEEGRTRYVSSAFRYDYFIKDHLGNVRMTVTDDEIPLSESYLATHEIASANIEEAIFTRLSEVRDIKPEGSPTDTRSAALDGSDEDKRIGTSILLNVMKGDHVNLSTYSYHNGKREEDIYADAEAMLGSVITALTGGVGGFEVGAEGNGAEAVNTMFTGNNYTVYEELKNGLTDPSKPRAYLNYLVFDDQMRLVSSQTGFIQVSGTSDSWQLMQAPTELTLNQNGYIAVYISNEQALPVWFDNVSVTVTHGSKLDEMHYYPHGLLISKTVAGGAPENKNRYQGKVMQDELGLQLYDFHARQYDPQIGRFWGIDPADQYPSGYTGMGNDPANMVDPSGMQSGPYTNPWVQAWQKQANTWHNFMLFKYSQRKYLEEMARREMPVVKAPDPFEGQKYGDDFDKETLEFREWVDNDKVARGQKRQSGYGFQDGKEGYFFSWVTVEDKYISTGTYGKDDFSLIKSWETTVHGSFAANVETPGMNNRQLFNSRPENEKWLATNITTTVNNLTLLPQAGLGFIENTATGRFLSNGLQDISKAEMAATMKLAKPLTRGIAVVNIAATATAATNDFVDGRYKSGTARVAVWSVAAGAAFIPVVGWGVSLGIGIADAIWGDDFYNYVEKNW